MKINYLLNKMQMRQPNICLSRQPELKNSLDPPHVA